MPNPDLMNALDTVLHLLRIHREARGWTDEAVAADVLHHLAIDPTSTPKNAPRVVVPGPTEDEVQAAEATARDAVARAHTLREQLRSQTEPEPEDASADAKTPRAGPPRPAITPPIRPPSAAAR